MLCPRPRWRSHARAPTPACILHGVPLPVGVASVLGPSITALCFLEFPQLASPSRGSCPSRGSVWGLSPPPTHWKLPEQGGGERGRGGAPPGGSVCVNLGFSFAGDLSLLTVASSVCVRVPDTGLQRGTSLTCCSATPLVRLLCPPDEPHDVLSEPFLHPWGRRLLRAPFPAPGSDLSTGSPLLPQGAPGSRPGAGAGLSLRLGLSPT